MANEIELPVVIIIDPDLTTFIKKTGVKHTDLYTKEPIKKGSSCYSITERADGGRRIIKHWVTIESYKEHIEPLL